ncbi:alanine racemase [Streptosporangium amethystogenes]|uniref:alanine racemase n=1 Tax=Streptosporangium amethystogenes TaxID=2002 RepID=UPI001B808400|nr:alanine racemase [Streptosporangium amethystogenes]
MSRGIETPAGTAAIRLPEGLDTPVLVVDAARLDANIARMAARARAAGVPLRPHAKTHKCAEIARRQLGSGAAGLTVATLGEAESFAAAGCDDLFIAYPLWAGGPRAARIRRLHETVRLRVGVDGMTAAELLAAATRGAGPLDVLIEIDCGGRRTGVPAEAVAGLAAGCLRLGLNVLGAFTHPGHAYATPAGAEPAAADERTALAVAGVALERLLGHPPVLSGGSTPTVVAGVAAPVNEVRPGTYVFGDRQQTYLSGMSAHDIALVVAARVVSTPRPGEAVIDAGSKALASDRPAWLEGYGRLLEVPEATIDAITEEHALVRGFRHPLAVGDLVGVVPNHVCTAVNLGTEFAVVADGAVVDLWPVFSR